MCVFINEKEAINLKETKEYMRGLGGGNDIIIISH